MSIFIPPDPEAASSLLLPQIAGYQRAPRVLLSDEPIESATALQMGIASEVVPPADAAARSHAQAAKLGEKPLASLTETKRLMKMHNCALTDARIDEEARIFGNMVTGPAAREAITAFSEKRKPNFSHL